MWRTVKVFVSSTFVDMRGERDYLARHIFPRLRRELIKWRIHLVEIDLRWGVASEDNVVEVCREVIDECRPRFVCLLGGRYGTIPPGHERSITHDEISHAVLDPPPGADCRYSYFYFRDPAVTYSIPEPWAETHREERGSEAAHKLAALKSEIEAAGFTPFIYHCRWDPQAREITELEELGDRVFEDILGSIRDEFGPPPSEPPDWFEEENAQQEAFIEERTAGYVVGSRRALLDDLAVFATSSAAPSLLVVTGPPGSGKSALLAKFVREFSAAHPNWALVSHFVGASAGSADVHDMLRRLCHELAQLADIAEGIPDDPTLLRETFERYLATAAKRAPIVLLIDALNQLSLPSGAAPTYWLPLRLPPNVRVIVSSLPGPALDALRSRPQRLIELPPLERADAEAIITGFLRRYGKRLERHQAEALLAKRDAGKPLYLLAALEELRTLGRYEEITDRIRELPETTEGLFEWILQRLEGEFGQRLVELTASYLFASRVGLSEEELDGLLQRAGVPGQRRQQLADLLLLLRPYLTRRGALLAFFHAQVGEATRRRYVASEETVQHRHGELADYFVSRGYDYRRTLTELTYHAIRSGDLSRLSAIVQTEFLQVKASILGEPEALEDAGLMARAFADAGEEYWDELVQVARFYATLSDRLRALPDVLPRLAREGRVGQIMSVIQIEPDEGQRALLMLAASVLLEDAGFPRLAADMQARAMEVIDVTRLEPRQAWLVRALMRPDAAPAAHHAVAECAPLTNALDTRGRRERDSSRSTGRDGERTRARVYVPASYVVAAYCLGFYRQVAIATALLWLCLYLGYRSAALASVCRGSPLGLATKALLCAWVVAVSVLLTNAAVSLLSALCAQFLSARRGHLQRIVLEMVCAALRAPEQRRWRAAVGALRFCSLLRRRSPAESFPLAAGEIAPVATLIAAASTWCRSPRQAAIFLYHALATADGSSLDAAIAHAWRRYMESPDREAVLRELFRHHLDYGHLSAPLLSALFGPLDAKSLAALVEALASDMLLGMDTLVAALRATPRATVATALIASVFSSPRPRKKWGLDRQVLRAAVDAWAVRYPVCWVEPLVYAAFVLLGLPALAHVLVLLAAPLVVAPQLFHLVQRYQPSYARIVDWEMDPTELRRKLEVLLRSRPALSGFESLAGRRRAINALLAHSLLVRRRGGWRATFKEVRRVLARLLRRGYLAEGRVCLVLEFMADRRSLEATLELTAHRSASPGRAMPTLRDHDEQLRRVLPMQPEWLRFVAVSAISAAGGVVMILGALCIPHGVPAGGLPGLIAEALAVAPLLVAVQHLLAAASELVGQTPHISAGRLPANAAGVAFLLASQHILGFIPALDPYVVLGELLVTTLWAPEFLSRWRGSDLLYPSPRELWWHRLLWSVLYLLGCAATGMVVAAVSIAFGHGPI